jgi:hydrogenase maturation protein HypF
MSNAGFANSMNRQADKLAARIERRRLRVVGRVQGVGFRPFIHHLAHAHHLSGFVLNDGEGVLVEAQGPGDELNSFATDIRVTAPKVAQIQSVQAAVIPIVKDEGDFQIRKSESHENPRTQISPDLAACGDCLSDMRNRADQRRFGYGLVNCTRCGPRFSIVRAVPYDRKNTTMSDFAMCERCTREYGDPADRRFHAQPIACDICGPKVELVDPKGKHIDGDPIALAAERLCAGEIIAIKGIGGFHLAARADDAAAVGRLRQKKHRMHKPFALMAADVEAAAGIIDVSSRGRELLTSPAAPIVIAPRRPGASIDPAVAPGSHRLGVMVAYTPIHHLIFDALAGRCPALVMTSANDRDEPLIFTNEEAVAHLGELCDAILWHERPIERPVDDSVVLDVPDRHPILLRRSRGYVPAPLFLPFETKSNGVCVGGELKNTVAVVRGNEVILSQHLGDLQNARTYANFKRTVRDLIALFDIQPQWIAHDMHPGYVSTLFAAQLANSLHIHRIAIQHHHAHAAAVLAEHGQTGPALAVVCDGTGYGTDSTVWGGELMVVDMKGFKRLGHLQPMSLPGGDAASKETWRCAMALLSNAFGTGFASLPILAEIIPDSEQLHFVSQMLKSHTNCFTSSAAGRLFDGVAALLGLASKNHFEAQAPMALESAATKFGAVPHIEQPLFKIHDHGTIEIDFTPFVRELVTRRKKGTPSEELAAIFHDQFAAAWEEAVMRAVEKTGLICVALSGGVMCNQLIDRLLTDRLKKRGLHVLRHRLVPPSDGGLALGQAALAAFRDTIPFDERRK